ncbi:MAG: hypothetical protein HFG92_05405 [Dorea sp.]|jgi:hypothetical protein|nr:hypothetical protein [Dorea sp.]
MEIRLLISKVSVFLIALSPFLVNYELPILHVNVTLIIYILIFFVTISEVLIKNNLKSLKELYQHFSCCNLMFFMLIYLIFELLYVNNPLGKIYSLVQIILLYIQVVGFIFFFSDKNVRNLYKKIMCNITIFMCSIIFIQYLLYYTGDFLPGGNTRTALIPFKSLFTVSVIMTSKQGMVIDGFFRPSAMFLEPSHFSAYCSIGLICLLFGSKKIDLKAIFVSIAICMTTSGIGIGSVAMIWAFYIFYDLKSRNKRRMSRAGILLILFLLSFIILYYNFSFFRTALNRFTGPDNALSGRLSGRLFIDELSGTSRLFGVGYRNFTKFDSLNISYYFSSITELLYCQGIVGTVLFCILYLLAVIKVYCSDNQEHFVVMVLAILYIIATEVFSANQLVKFIPFLFV